MWQELWCRAGRDPESRTLAIELYRRPPGWIQETLEDGIASGEFTPCDTERARAADQLAVRRVRRPADVPAPALTLEAARERDLGASPYDPLGIDYRVPGERPTMTAQPLDLSRRGLLFGGAAAARCSARPGCAYIDPPSPEGGAGADGAGDRRRPRLLQLGGVRAPQGAQGLQGGVRRRDHPVELRLDGGHAGQARRREPLRHHLPVGAVGAEADGRQPAAHDRPLDAGERAGDLRPLRLLRRPLVRPGFGALDPVHDVQDRASPGARTSSATSSPAAGTDLWNEDVERHDVRPRRPRRGAGHGRAAARACRSTPPTRTTSTRSSTR